MKDVLDYRESIPKIFPDQKLTTVSKTALHNFSSVTNYCLTGQLFM